MNVKSLKQPALWALVIGFGSGVLAAFPFAAPVFEAVIPDAAATLWGSALGALIAVAGAFWVSDRAQGTTRRNAAALVLEMVGRTAFFLQELRDAYGSPSAREDHAEQDEEPGVLTAEDWGDVRSAIDILLAEYDALKKKIHRIEAALGMLGPAEMRSYLNLESELEITMEVVHKLRERANEAGLLFYPGPASWAMRFALLVHARNINGYIEQLEKAAR